jgi:streptogramin lyase
LYVVEAWNHTVRKITPGGLVTTLAGLAGERGSADGSGSAARFSGPVGVAVDGLGNIYVADGDNHLIRKITSAGSVSTLAGLAGQKGSSDGLGTTARFRQPSGVAVDSGGILYVTDQNNHTIRKITPAGVVTTLVGRPSSYALGPGSDGPRGLAQFALPRGVAADVAGNVYVAEATAVRKINANGQVTTLAGALGQPGWVDGPTNVARFDGATGIAPDSSGNLYVTERNNHAVRKITPAGLVSTLWGGPQSTLIPEGVTVDNADIVYVPDRRTGYVWRYTAQIGWSPLTDSSGSPARFGDPRGVAVDGQGNVYVAIYQNAILRLTPGGKLSTLAGVIGQWGNYEDGTGSSARISGPRDLAFDKDGGLLFLDNCRLRRVTPDGVVTTLAGDIYEVGNMDGTGRAVRFGSLEVKPSGLACDAAGRVYVVDEYNGTVRIGFKACADRPVVDVLVAPVGVTRQLDTAPQTADGWQWTWIRRPANSQAQLSSATIRNPTFTPDVPDLFIFRLQATNSVTGEVALRTLEIRATPTNSSILTPPQRQTDGSMQLSLIAQTNAGYTLTVSSNLSTWTNWTNVTPANIVTPLTDSDAVDQAHRFYRAQSP